MPENLREKDWHREQERHGGRPAGRVFSTAPGTSFLEELAKALVYGRLVEGFRPIDDPLLLPTATVYLPTRRAARAFSAEIVTALGGEAALLPAIRTLGDSDEEEFGLAFSVREAAELPPAAGALERQFVLARMVHGWTDHLSRATQELFGDEDIVLPSSTSDALKLANDLARLLDQMETEEIAWSALDEAIGEEHAEWWGLTATFLKIVVDHWPDYLREAGKLDPAEARRLLLDLRARQLAEAPLNGPVIAAGSTGSIPATARLLGAIARHEKGAIVLPGVDFDLPEPVWRQLANPEDKDELPLLSTHPQYGLARLIDQLGVVRSDIAVLGQEPEERAPRFRALGIALLPASQTGQWQVARNETKGGAGDYVAIIEAPGEREEALAIAIAMREALEDPHRTAALTTPDRKLARRVAAELRRFGIEIDDSAGMPLSETEAGRFARLLVAATIRPGNAVELTAFLKDPVLAGANEHFAHAARLFELLVLRGALVVPAPGALEATSERTKSQTEKSYYGPVTISSEDWEALNALARHVDQACEALAEIGRGGETGITGAAAAIRTAIAALLDDPDGAKLARLSGGRELIRLFDSFDTMTNDTETIDTGDRGVRAAARELPEIFDVLTRNETVLETRRPHPRLNIWGPLEARLQHVDLMILGGLNEGSWPAPARNDPFLNRPMRGAVGLSLPERRIGQAAHDFEQLSGAEEVIYARAAKADNAPTVASRWLQRFMVVAGEDASGKMLKRGQRYLDLAAAIDRDGTDQMKRAVRPCPKPPLALRPTRLSVTEIETWIRDPYAIHARHVLGLRPLEPLERVADPALRGTIYHEALARYVRDKPEGETPEAAMARLDEIAQALFASHAVPVEIAAGWLPRFREIAKLFVEWDASRAGEVETSLCEVKGTAQVGEGGFTLSGRADRIDLTTDGRVSIFDYKTGVTPSAKQARIFSPQLSLEGRMAELGAFGPEAARPAGDLAYVRLRPGDELKVESISSERENISIDDLVTRAWQELEKLVDAYALEGQGYLSRYAVMREGEVGGDYDHLARVREWSLGAEDGDGGEDG